MRTFSTKQMATIPSHIREQLLYTREVREAGAGTYSVKRLPAAFGAGLSADTEVLLPPQYVVVFTPEQIDATPVEFTAEECAFLPQNFGMKAAGVPARRVMAPVEAVTTPAKSEVSADQVVISIHKSVLRYAAASVIGLIMLAVSPKTSDSSQASYASLAPVNYAAIVAERTAKAEAEEVPVFERGHYHVIVASVDKANAERYAAELISRGYDAITIERDQNAYRVAIASYATQREALQAMEQFRESSEFARAWVCKK